MEGFERFGQMYFSYAYSLNKWLFSEVVLFFKVTNLYFYSDVYLKEVLKLEA